MEIFPLELNEVKGPASFNCKGPAHLPPRSQSQNGFRPLSYSGVRRTRSISISSDHTKVLNGQSSAILFRDSQGYPVLQPLGLKSDSIMEDAVLNFFKCYKCYDLIPTSAKLVVLDTDLIVKRAFYAMIESGVRACPLWDSELQQYVGMLTITDFIRILQNNYKGPGLDMTAFEDLKLRDVKGVSTEEPGDLLHMYPDSSLFDATALLLRRKIHRLPIIDYSNGNVLYIMTQKPLIKFLYTFFPNLDKVPFLQKTLSESGVGTYSNIKVATKETKIIEALNIFVAERISALPIVDEDGKLIHIYSKFDVINLAAEKSYSHLDVSLEQANQHKTMWFTGVHKCTADETLYTVIDRLVKTDVARLVVVDAEDKVVGVVTVSDIIRSLIMRTNPTVTAERKIRSMEDMSMSLASTSLTSTSLTGSNGGYSCSPPRWFQV